MIRHKNGTFRSVSGLHLSEMSTTRQHGEVDGTFSGGAVNRRLAILLYNL